MFDLDLSTLFITLLVMALGFFCLWKLCSSKKKHVSEKEITLFGKTFKKSLSYDELINELFVIVGEHENKIKTQEDKIKKQEDKIKTQEDKINSEGVENIIQKINIDMLMRKNDMLLNSYQVLYFRKIANILLHIILTKHKNSFVKTEKIFIDTDRPEYLRRKFAIILAKEKINEIKKQEDKIKTQEDKINSEGVENIIQ